MDFTLVLLLGVTVLLGLSIGATGVSTCFATTFGSGILSHKKSLLVVFIFLIVGSMMQGNHVTKTISKGLVDISSLSFQASIAMILGASILLLLFAFYGIPSSNTQAIVGSLLGVSLILEASINWNKFLMLFIFWILTPLIAIFFGGLSYYFISKILENANILKFERYIKYFVVGSMIFLSYSFGASHVGLVVGLMSNQTLISVSELTILAALSMGFGAIFFSKRVTLAIGKKITELDPRMAFSSQTGGAITIYMMAILGVPTSSTQAMVGGIAGTGLSKSIATVDKSQLWKIFRGWVITPLLGAFLGILSFYTLGAIL